MTENYGVEEWIDFANRPDATKEQIESIMNLVFNNNTDDIGKVEKFIHLLGEDIRRKFIPFEFIIRRVKHETKDRRKFILQCLAKIIEGRHDNFRMIIGKRWRRLRYDDKVAFERLENENRNALGATDSVASGSILYLCNEAPRNMQPPDYETEVAKVLYQWYQLDENTKRLYEYIERVDFKEGRYVKELVRQISQVNSKSIRIAFIIEIRRRRMRDMELREQASSQQASPSKSPLKKGG